jgi:hypothetical protein
MIVELHYPSPARVALADGAKTHRPAADASAAPRGGAEPNNWDESAYADLKAKAASYNPPMHILTYALGDDAPAAVLQRIACENAGVFYPVNTATLADAMAGYFQVLAPMLAPCEVQRPC